MDPQQSSALRQNHAEDCAANHSDMSGDGPNSLPAKASESAEQRYKFELQELVTYLRDRQCCLRDSNVERIEFFLPAEQFEQFDELVSCGEFAGRRVRYDYSYASQTLALRMPGIRHEIIVDLLKRCLNSFIDREKDKMESSMAKFAASLVPTGSADLYYSFKDAKSTIKRQPDLSITAEKNPKYPVLVGEVALSQTTKELQNLAQEYIEHTRGHIRTVIIVDLDYPRGKGAWLSVWKAKFGEDGKFEGVACDDAVEIRNKDGVKNPNSQARLFLSLEDFGLVRGTDNEDADLQSVAAVSVFNIDDLCKELERADKMDESRKGSNAERPWNGSHHRYFFADQM